MFANLTLAELAHIRAALKEAEAEPGAVLIAEGDPPGTPLFVLLEGEACVSKTSGDGRAHPVGWLRAPNIFGELDVLSSRPALASVTAQGKVAFATLSGDAVAALCEAAHPAILKVLHNLTRAMRYRSMTCEAGMRPGGSPHRRLGSVRRALFEGWALPAH